MSLPLWYSAADCFVMPSLYEGFGLAVAGSDGLRHALRSRPIARRFPKSPAMPHCSANRTRNAIAGRAESFCCTMVNCGIGCMRRVRTRAAEFTWQRTAELTAACVSKGGRSMRERVRDISEFELIGRLRDALPVAARRSDAVPVGHRRRRGRLASPLRMSRYSSRPIP